MARLIRRSHPCTHPETGKHVRRRAVVWYGRYLDAEGVPRTVALSADKATAKQMLDERVRRVKGWKTAIGMSIPGGLGSSCKCLECGHVYGWYGAFLAMPPCPKCGWRPRRSMLHRLEQVR